MMSFLGYLVFLIPLVFFVNYWVLNLFLFFACFLFFFSFSFSSVFSNLSYGLGVDLLSFMLIFLSFWICSLMLLASELIYFSRNFHSLFVFFILVLLNSLLMVFSSMNLFVFYFFFEFSLIPTLFLIIGWGYQPERIEAGMYLLMYTLFVSLPMMIGLFKFYYTFNSLEFVFLGIELDNLFMFFCMTMVFFVKVPIFMMHLWLPKAHVEAPISGSMILAGVMLKLGGYGLMRLIFIFKSSVIFLSGVFISISLWGGVLISLICLRQSDIKMIIAYSSVCHMGLVLGGLFTLNLFGFWGSFAMMISHGLCSSGLFCLLNIVYERTGSRSLYLNKGLINLFPNLSLWWFLFCCGNMAAPPSLNLLSEIFLINSLISYSKVTFFMLFFISFFSAAYSLFLYSYTQHGKFYSGLYGMSPIKIREYLLLFLHLFPLYTLILKGDYFLFWV